MKTRIYKVETLNINQSSLNTDLVRAVSQAQAERHISKRVIIATVATQEELIDMIGKKVEVLDATIVPGEQLPLEPAA